MKKAVIAVLLVIGYGAVIAFGFWLNVQFVRWAAG